MFYFLFLCAECHGDLPMNLDNLLYSHGQKYWHPCTSVRQCTTSLRKLLQLQMLWYSHVYLFLFALEKLKKSEKKSEICYHSTHDSKNGLDTIIGTISEL